MHLIKTLLLILGIAVLPAIHATAEMPETLKGSWILDAEATEANLQTSPKWKPEDAKFLPTIFKRMSQITYVFEDDRIVAIRQKKGRAIEVKQVESDDKQHVLTSTVRGQDLTVTVIFVDDETINIRLSATNDMDYYLWKRGTPNDADGPSDAALATEVAAKALEKDSGENTPAK